MIRTPKHMPFENQISAIVFSVKQILHHYRVLVSHADSLLEKQSHAISALANQAKQGALRYCRTNSVGGHVDGRGDPENPGSDGASPYLPIVLVLVVVSPLSVCHLKRSITTTSTIGHEARGVTLQSSSWSSSPSFC